VSRPWDAEDHAAERDGRPKAEAKRLSTKFSRVDEFSWTGEPLLGTLCEGDQLLQIYKEGRTKFVYPAGRVVHVQDYKAGSESRAIVYLEVKKRLKRKRLATVVRTLGPKARVLKKIVYARLLKNSTLVHALLHLWPRKASLPVE
jgi:hypothetical protein